MSDSKYQSFDNVHDNAAFENELPTDEKKMDLNDDYNEPEQNPECCRCENKLNNIHPKYTISICCVTWGFLTGVERAIILPTLWLYFQTRFGSEAAKSYYGITLASFNLAVFLIAPLYGYLATRGFRTKALLVISNQLEVVGNIIYFIASEPWMVMLGRFIAGLGSGSEVPLYADIVRVTKPEERTPYIVFLLLARQVGLIIGPAATLMLHPVKFQIGNISLNIYNSPGFLMAILWALQTVQVLISYPDVDKSGNILKPKSKNINERIMQKFYHRDSAESDKLLIKREKPKNCFQRINHFWDDLKVYRTYTIGTLLFIQFTTYFCLMALEAVIPPVTIRNFKWTEVHNSYLYLAAGILVILIYAVLHKVSQYVKDRSVLLVALVTLICGYIWMSFCMGFVNPKEPVLYITLMSTAALFHIFGLSLAIPCSESLYTKSLPAEEMDFAQTVLRTTVNLSLLIGPYIAGSLQMVPYIVFVILFTFVFASFVLFATKYKLFEREN